MLIHYNSASDLMLQLIHPLALHLGLSPLVLVLHMPVLAALGGLAIFFLLL